MTIEILSMNVVAGNSASYLSRGANASTSAIDSAATNLAADNKVHNDAAQTIQSHLSGRTDPPQFRVDYLSGLDVMTVRAANSGDVIFQLPGPAAVRLAQLLKEGAPVESFGIVNQTA